MGQMPQMNGQAPQGDVGQMPQMNGQTPQGDMNQMPQDNMGQMPWSGPGGQA